MMILSVFEGHLSWAIACIASLVAWYILSSLYYWYRLRHIPGPFLARFSYLWVANLSLTGIQHETQLKLNRTYGPLVRVGPNEVLHDNPELVRKFSNTNSTYTKGEWYLGSRFNPYHDPMFLITDPAKHDRVKAKLAPAYSGRDAPNLEDVVDRQVQSLVQLIKDKYISKPGDFRPFVLSKAASLFTLDVISHLALGKEFGCLRADFDIHGIHRAFTEHLPILSFATDVAWLRRLIFSPAFLWLFGPSEKDTWGVGRLMKLANDVVRERYQPDAEDKRDMLGSFRRHGLTLQECQTESLFMFLAGSETTAAVIRVVILYVIASPHIYSRLKKELADAIAEGRVSSPISDKESRQLPFLQAVIYEAIRIRPTTTSMFFKDIPPGGETIHGKFLPAGTSVGTNTSSLLHSEAVFGPDAHIYRPERFLEVDKETSAHMKRHVELMFGYGRWICAGKPIAFMELNKVLFELLRAFDFQLAEPRAAMPSKSYIVFHEKGPILRVTEAARQDQ